MVCRSTSGRLALKQGKTKYDTFDLSFAESCKNWTPFLTPSLLGEKHGLRQNGMQRIESG